MLKINDKSQCSGCSACVVSCPVQSIKMVEDNEGFLYPLVDEQTCIHCGLCEIKCPIIKSEKSNIHREAEAYAARSLNDIIRENSSSGGIFSELAKWVIHQDGVVIGAGFNPDFSVEHISVEYENELSKLRGAKYVQSVIGESYINTKSFLENGRYVLFSGTPCQISGLYQYLGRDYEKLITQDVICHGAPSPMLWKKYLEYQSQKHGRGKINRISFRDKKTGWKKYSLTIEYENKKRYSKIYSKDMIMRAFLKNLCLRPSCYNCAFKNITKESDITLGDFWGIEHLLPEWDDDKGISLVLLNSQKGKAIFSKIQSGIAVHEVECEEAIKYNLSAIKSSARPYERDTFIHCVENQGFQCAARKYLKVSLWRRIKNRIKRICV